MRKLINYCISCGLERATNPLNENVDKAAVEAFCVLINKENEGAHIGIRLLANKIHAKNEKEALQTLGVFVYFIATYLFV